MEKGREYILQNVAAATQLFGAVAGIRVQIILPPKPGANSDCTGTWFLLPVAAGSRRVADQLSGARH